MIDYRCKSVALFSQFRLLRQLSFSSTLSKKKKRKKKTYKAGSRGSFTAGTGTKKNIISCTGGKSTKSVILKKARNESENFWACHVF